MRLLILSILIFLTFTSCQFKKDIAFISDAQANLPSFLVTVNERFCTDAAGEFGLCALALKNDQILKIKLPNLPYDVRLQLTCTEALGISQSIFIPKNNQITVEVKEFFGLKSFTCIGEVFPVDRNDVGSSLFHVRVVLTDPNHVRIDKPFFQIKNNASYYYLGNYSYLAGLCDEELNCQYVSKKQLIQVKQNPVVIWNHSWKSRNYVIRTYGK